MRVAAGTCIIDGEHGAARKFSDYANQVFIPYILSQLQHVNRVDVVADEYLPDSLKAETRSKRGKGVRRRVGACNAIPGIWQDDNKAELFSYVYLAICVSALDAGKHAGDQYTSCRRPLQSTPR